MINSVVPERGIVTQFFTLEGDSVELERTGSIPLHYAKWSPDGSMLAYISLGEYQVSTVFVVDWEGDLLVQFDQFPSLAMWGEMSWVTCPS